MRLMVTRYHRTIIRLAKILPVVVVYQSFGCLPDNAFNRVLGENLILTSAVVIQTITSLVFNTIFGVA